MKPSATTHSNPIYLFCLFCCYSLTPTFTHQPSQTSCSSLSPSTSSHKLSSLLGKLLHPLRLAILSHPSNLIFPQKPSPAAPTTLSWSGFGLYHRHWFCVCPQVTMSYWWEGIMAVSFLLSYSRSSANAFCIGPLLN